MNNVTYKSIRHDKIILLQYHSKPRPYWRDTPNSWKEDSVMSIDAGGTDKLLYLYRNSSNQLVFEIYHSGALTPYYGKVLSIQEFDCHCPYCTPSD